MFRYSTGALFAKGSEVTQADLDAVSQLPSMSNFAPSLNSSPAEVVAAANSDSARFRRQKALQLAAAATAAKKSETGEGGILDDAKTKARSEVGLLALLTAPAWGTLLLTFLSRR